MIDGRSDLACGVVLAELLTGQARASAAARRRRHWEVVARALSPDPRGRPQSAAQFDAEPATPRPGSGDRTGRTGRAHRGGHRPWCDRCDGGGLRHRRAPDRSRSRHRWLRGLGGGGAIVRWCGVRRCAAGCQPGGDGWSGRPVAKLNALAAPAVVVFGTGLAVAVVDPTRSRRHRGDQPRTGTDHLRTPPKRWRVSRLTSSASPGTSSRAWWRTTTRSRREADQAVVGHGPVSVPAWFVGSGRLVHDDGAISIFAVRAPGRQ